MSKMHTLAKILVTIAVIYWLVKAISYLLPTFTYIFAYASQGKMDTKTSLIIMTSVLSRIFIILFLIFVLYKRNKITERIVGQEETAAA